MAITNEMKSCTLEELTQRRDTLSKEIRFISPHIDNCPIDIHNDSYLNILIHRKYLIRHVEDINKEIALREV